MSLRYALLNAIPGQARRCLSLRGPDTGRFLQGTVTCDVEGLAVGHASPGAVLTVKGKLVSELIVVPGESGGIDLLVPADQAESLCSLLNRHIIMDDVEVAAPRELGLALILDPAGDAVDGAGVRAFATRHPAPGVLVMGETDALANMLGDAQAVTAATFDDYRIATATPAWGAELRPDVFPPEVGFTYAVSYAKGCYMGQEPLARIHARGQVNRVMVRVEPVASIEVPAALSHPDREVAGTLTTAVAADAGLRGLAIVRREFAHPQVELRAGTVVVRVVSEPLGDDPGIGRQASNA